MHFFRRLPLCNHHGRADEVVTDIHGVIAHLKGEGRTLRDVVSFDVYDRVSWSGELRYCSHAIDVLLVLTKYDNGGSSVSHYLNVRKLSNDKFAMHTWEKHFEWC